MTSVAVRTSMPDHPVAGIPLGIVNSWTRTVFRNGQCLSLALAVHSLLPGSRVVALLVDDDDWFDEGWQERTHLSDLSGTHWLERAPYAVHVLVETPQGEWVDSNGWHDPEGFMEALRDVQGPAAAVYVSASDAEAVVTTTFPPQHWSAGRAFAQTLLRSA